MKKLILITTFTSLLASSAFAKTSGHEVGINVSRNSAKHEYTNLNGYSGFDDSSIGFGGTYKYAFNFDKIFLAPEIFADYLGTEAKDQDGDPTSLNYRYGAKLNLGYDVTDNIAIYGGVGAATVNYEVKWDSSKATGDKITAIYAIGTSYNMSKNLALNLEYNHQSLDLKTPGTPILNIKADSKISAIKLGIGYRF